MYKLKTTETDSSVDEFIQSVESPKKREDAYRLTALFSEATGYEPKMWGKSMIGFGKYHYKYASGHEGEAMLVGFSPRKAKISLYLGTCNLDLSNLLAKLGKHTTGKSCVYINKLEDVDPEVLTQLIKQSLVAMKEAYPDQEQD